MDQPVVGEQWAHLEKSYVTKISNIIHFMPQLYI